MTIIDALNQITAIEFGEIKLNSKWFGENGKVSVSLKVKWSTTGHALVIKKVGSYN
jgi:hypothetical protein